MLIPMFPIMLVAIGAKIIAPEPNPAAVKPPAKPFLSGNHLTVSAVAVP